MEDRAAVEGDKILAFELEGDDHHRAGLARAELAVAGGFDDLRVFEDGGVEQGGFFSLAVVP